MRTVYVARDNLVSPLGFDSQSNIEQVAGGHSGIRQHNNDKLLPQPFFASIIDRAALNDHFTALAAPNEYTLLEKMMILSLQGMVEELSLSENGSHLLTGERTALLISTTKGNIDALSGQSAFPKERAYLPQLGEVVRSFFGFHHPAIVISNACISGILAVAVAKRLIQQEVYDHVFITSGDLVTAFVLSGFQSFQAISGAPCRPYSKKRTGINIGEAAASVLVTSDNILLGPRAVAIRGDGSCNDANHISGPSRTGEGLVRSVESALGEARLSANNIDYISAHGTATLYNDEMEAIAFNRLGLGQTPLNSLKGYYGHTLGASGLLEAIVGIHSVCNNDLYQSLGFDEPGTSQPLRVIEQTHTREEGEKPLSVFLKTASGFGGCNAAVLFEKWG